MAKKILVVDDEEDIRWLLSDLLVSEGFSVETAEDGYQGFQCFKNEPPELVITDVKMPKRTGLDLLKDIKDTGSNVDVIVLTGHSDETTAIECLRSGAYDYLLKPLEDLDVLLASVQRALQKRDLEAKNHQLVKELEEMAIRDALTGLFNHRHLIKCLSEEIARSSRYNHSFVGIMVDIDHFKAINDRYGHLFGDFVLKRMAYIFEDNLRLTDKIFRYGGEEFFLLLPETNMTQAVVIAGRLLDSIRGYDFNCDGHHIQLTVSAGVAEFPDEAQDTSQIIGLADRRLYRAKTQGRDGFDVGQMASIPVHK